VPSPVPDLNLAQSVDQLDYYSDSTAVSVVDRRRSQVVCTVSNAQLFVAKKHSVEWYTGGPFDNLANALKHFSSSDNAESDTVVAKN
jgi:hypothetical protein